MRDFAGEPIALYGKGLAEEPDFESGVEPKAYGCHLLANRQSRAPWLDEHVKSWSEWHLDAHTRG